SAAEPSTNRPSRFPLVPFSIRENTSFKTRPVQGRGFVTTLETTPPRSGPTPGAIRSQPARLPRGVTPREHAGLVPKTRVVRGADAAGVRRRIGRRTSTGGRIAPDRGTSRRTQTGRRPS